VTFDIDANGILHVSAKDKATGKENKIKIQASSGLSEDEIKRMVQDAEAHAEDDRKARELIDARNQCDSMVHSVKKSLAEYGDKVAADEKGRIEAALKEAEESLKSDDKAVIEAKTRHLTQPRTDRRAGPRSSRRASRWQGPAGSGGEPGNA
jgi:molecular chaperone DnaK